MIKKTIAYKLLRKLSWLKKHQVGYAVLTYHDIIPDEETDFSDPMKIKYSEFFKQMKMISDNFPIYSIKELHKKIINKDIPKDLCVSITFDDGYLNQLSNAAPLLQKLNIPATFFITTDFAYQRIIPQLERWKSWIKLSQNKINLESIGINETFDLKNISEKRRLYNRLIGLLPSDIYDYEDDKLNSLLNKLFCDETIPRIYMNWKEINELNKISNFTIGAHSVSHPNLKKVKNFLEDEVIKSKNIIESNIQQKVKYFAYPFGTNNELDKNIIDKMHVSNFDLAFSSILGLNQNPKSIYCLNRIAPLCNESITIIKNKIYWSREIRKMKDVLNWKK